VSLIRYHSNHLDYSFSFSSSFVEWIVFLPNKTMSLPKQKIYIRIYQSSALTFVSCLFLLSLLRLWLRFFMHTSSLRWLLSWYIMCELLLSHYFFFLYFFFFFFLPICWDRSVGFFLLYWDTNIVGICCDILFPLN